MTRRGTAARASRGRCGTFLQIRPPPIRNLAENLPKPLAPGEMDHLVIRAVVLSSVAKRVTLSYTSKSSGSPTERFEFSVESIEMSAHLATSSSGEA